VIRRVRLRPNNKFNEEEAGAVDKLDPLQGVSVEIVYFDEDLVKLATIVSTGRWRGRARAYTVPQDIAKFATDLERFVSGTVGAAEFTAGADNGIGLIALRFYRIDRAGHIVCHVRLASGGLPTHCRPEQVSRFAVEVGAEAWAVHQFARQLAELSRTQSGQAVLAVELDAAQSAAADRPRE
jgi:hypothetical protein